MQPCLFQVVWGCGTTAGFFHPSGRFACTPFEIAIRSSLTSRSGMTANLQDLTATHARRVAANPRPSPNRLTNEPKRLLRFATWQLLDRKEIGLFVRLAGDCYICLFECHGDGSQTTGGDFMSLELTTYDPDFSRCFDPNSNPIARDAVDRQYNIVADYKLLTFFATQHQHNCFPVMECFIQSTVRYKSRASTDLLRGGNIGIFANLNQKPEKHRFSPFG